MATPISDSDLMAAATRLYNYIYDHHWDGHAMSGPDSGVRFNFRIGRFIKRMFRFIPWGDNYIFQQGQAYWIFANWLLADMTGSEKYREAAIACSRYVISMQQPKGYWEYPNPEWKGRIATVEGDFASLGLLETYERTKDSSFLDASLKWHDYLMTEVSFMEVGDGMLAINYFSNLAGGVVPNNTAITLRLAAKLASVTGNTSYLNQASAMVAFMNHVQKPSGELPYEAPFGSEPGRPHFLCFQYNAFQFLDLLHYYQLTHDQKIVPVLERLATFLSTGLGKSGAARYDCFRETPEVPYYTAVVAAALSQATAMGWGDHHEVANKAFRRVMQLQRPDGSVAFFSRGNYKVLTDRRPYVRNLAMILTHFLMEVQSRKIVGAETPVC
jgi:uncharacterized protein YyaL (SSP411 family)